MYVYKQVFLSVESKKKYHFLSYLKSILLLNYSLLAVIYSTCTFV